MGQGTSSVSLEVIPAAAQRLESLIDDLRARAKAAPAGYGSVLQAAPALHYMSLSLCRSGDFDPLFVIEVNYDLPAGAFWLQLDAAIGETLRDMLRCCKRPRNGDGDLYDAAVKPGSRASVAPYLERRASVPSVYHHGNRGLSRQRIVDERELFLATRKSIAANEAAWRKLPPEALHENLRGDLIAAHPWLDAAVPPRISRGERFGDLFRFVAAVVTVLLQLSLPGFVLALLLPEWLFVAAVLALAAAISFGLYRLAEPLAGVAPGDTASLVRSLLRHWKVILAGSLIYLVVVAPAGTALVWLGGQVWNLGTTWHQAAAVTARPLLLSLLSVATVVLPGLVLWIRGLERRDATQDAPQVPAEKIAEMAHREDWLCQNHMVSIVLLKPGVLRALVIHLGHRLLHLWLRLSVTDGYLGAMRTIHFAHWAFIDNGARLMFHSNFDLSWETYLDDFIEKAHEGLTLAWGAGVGFPPTRLLVGDGASNGRLFKAWARQSMSVTGFWYCAYPDLTVDQIERNYRVAQGLRQPRLARTDAAKWMVDL